MQDQLQKQIEQIKGRTAKHLDRIGEQSSLILQSLR